MVLADKDFVKPSTHVTDAVQDIVSQDSSPQHKPITANDTQEPTANDKGEDSFVTSIKLRTPAKIRDIGIEEDPSGIGDKSVSADAEESQSLEESKDQEHESKDNSSFGRIITRSPAKTMTRIEDTVEAIDAFEDEIEKIGELMPTIGDAVSPVNTKKPTKPVVENAASITNSAGSAKTTRSKAVRNPEAKGGSLTNGDYGVQLDQARAAMHDDPNDTLLKKLTTTAAKRVSSIHKPPFQPTKSSKPPTRPNFELTGDAVARKLKEQREERLRRENAGEIKKLEIKAAPKPIKSTKPLTYSTFQLPGEAVARKLKEQREQRLKKQEADSETKSTESKARRVRPSQPPVVKGTATSKARISLAKGEVAESKKSNSRAPTIRPAVKRSASTAPANTSKRLSSFLVAKRTPPHVTGPSACTTSGQSLAATSPSRLSTSIATQRVTSNGKCAHQTARGREVFERNNIATMELERIRKEKEDAARKARAEAADRGRIASRQWAEKQKTRKIRGEKATAAEAREKQTSMAETVEK